MPNVDLDVLGADRAEVDAALQRLCEGGLDATGGPIAAAIRYSLLGEGKRLRALIVIETYRAAGGAGDVSGLAAAVEIVHAYSLVHDDLPCMDDDYVRRGRPTVHRVYGVAAATAAGVTMVPLAARTAYEQARALGLTESAAGSIVRELMRAAGAGGMIGGQWLDLQAEGQRLAVDDLERIHRAKTGMLITASARIGARAARAPDDVVDVFARYGEALGLAFQIADDVLDVTSTTDQLGKTAGHDAALKKSTYPVLLGVEEALARARSLADRACHALRDQGFLTPALQALARYVVERKS
jgi:farnesyl diphosphate synthase/geranylgeranyl diphosphate synthase type II